MAIKYQIAALDDVDEKFRDLYKEEKDDKGKPIFVLQVEGVRTQKDVDNVTRAKRMETDEHAKTKKALQDATEKLTKWGELDPEQVTTQLEKLTTLEAAGNVPDLVKNFDTTVQARVQTLLGEKVKAETAKLQKQITELTDRLTTSDTTAKTLGEQIRHRTIDDAVRVAAVTAKVTDHAVSDALIHARGQFKIGEDGKVATEDGKDPSQWLEERKQVSPHWWPQSRGAGAHGSEGMLGYNGANPWSAEGWSVSKQSELVRTDATKAQRLAEAAGSKIGATSPVGHVFNKTTGTWVKPTGTGLQH